MVYISDREEEKDCVQGTWSIQERAIVSSLSYVYFISCRKKRSQAVRFISDMKVVSRSHNNPLRSKSTLKSPTIMFTSQRHESIKPLISLKILR